MEPLPIPRNAGLIAAAFPQSITEQAALLAAQLARRGPVTVLDGGNCFPFYRFARLARIEGGDGVNAAQRLFIRRAFTCYQMLALLESTPALPQPYLILDLPGTFYDEQVPAWEVTRLLDACLRETKRLCLHAPVILLLPPPRLPERAHLLERICLQADRSFVFDDPAPAPVQPALF